MRSLKIFKINPIILKSSLFSRLPHLFPYICCSEIQFRLLFFYIYISPRFCTWILNFLGEKQKSRMKNFHTASFSRIVLRPVFLDGGSV